jgi:hypothetical protein
MTPLRQELLEAARFLPRHRERSRRERMLPLDDLIEDARLNHKMAGGVLDMILMGYRLHAAFLTELRRFNTEPLRPLELEDLLAVTFAAMVTRTQTAPEVLSSEAVEAAKKAFGPACTGFVNAFCRQLSPQLPALRERLAFSPIELLGTHRDRLSRVPGIERLARALLVRPEPGVWAFGPEGKLERHDVSEFEGKHLQAMDPGSWDLAQLWADKLKRLPEGATVLDACAAPGGKFIAAQVLAARPDLRFYATDSKFPRLQRLKENLARWGFDAPTALHAWGMDKWPSMSAPGWPTSFDAILADLPCTGSGTLHTRPDVLLSDFRERLEGLRPLQSSILKALIDLKPQLLVVSVCSVDPAEIDGISGDLGRNPDARSLERLPPDVVGEGITTWVRARPRVK